MGWRDELRKASFKGVAFHVEDHEATYGRRLVTNEYPYRDEPYTEDMGRKARRWSITGYLIGQNYMAARDKLLDAVEAGGSGQLVHPYLGTKTVCVEEISCRETQRDGGYVELRLSCVEAGVKTFPSGLAVPSKLTALGADNLIGISKGIFTKGITLQGVSEFVREAYAGNLGSVSDLFGDIQLAGGINLQSTISKVNQAAEWATSLAELRLPSVSLIQDVFGVSDRIVSLFKGVLDLGGDSKQSAKNLAKFSGYTATTTTSTTNQGAAINQNAAVTERFVRTVALANESKALVGQNFDSYDEAITTREYLLQRIDAVADNSQDDSEYDALQALRKQVGAAIPSTAADLPRLGTIVLPQSEPALVLSYDLYASVDREADIIARNKVRHPGFVPGGAELEVLRDGKN